MDATAAMFGEGRRQARWCEAISRNAGAREWQPLGHATRGTLPAPGDGGLVSGKASGKLWIEHQKIAITSRWASICGRRDRPIRKKVIGHGVSVCGESFTSKRVFLHLLRAFPLVHQPARQHCRGIFFHPLVEKGANLLAEISGVAEPREFIALQRSSRSREKKLPRRLGFVVGHGASRTMTAH